MAETTRTVFEQIMAGEIPAKFVHQDEQCIAFHDINPAAPFHILVVPRVRIVRIAESDADDASLLGHLLATAAAIARAEPLAADGFRIVINNGQNGGESVPHLHLHVLAGRALAWPPG